MSELFSQNRARGWCILCVTWIQFLIIKNGCVGEYIFFLFWPWNKIFENRRYLSTPPLTIQFQPQPPLVHILCTYFFNSRIVEAFGFEVASWYYLEVEEVMGMMRRRCFRLSECLYLWSLFVRDRWNDVFIRFVFLCSPMPSCARRFKIILTKENPVE